MDNNKGQFIITEDLLAPIGRRFLNFAIDIVMLSILLFIVLLVYLSNVAATPQDGKLIMERFMNNGLWQFMFTAIPTLVYYNFFEIVCARTVGKFCTNTIVVDENGNKASYEAIMFRSLVRIVPMYWIFSILSPKRGLHDLISKTYVVDKRKLEEAKRNL